MSNNMPKNYKEAFEALKKVLPMLANFAWVVDDVGNKLEALNIRVKKIEDDSHIGEQ